MQDLGLYSAIIKQINAFRNMYLACFMIIIEHLRLYDTTEDGWLYFLFFSSRSLEVITELPKY